MVRVAVTTWENRGSDLGTQSSPSLMFHDIKRIEADIPTLKSTPCYIAVFDTWKNKGTEDYTWDTLLKVLRTLLVDASKLASTIEGQLS